MSTWSYIHSILASARQVPLTVMARDKRARDLMMSRLMNAARHPDHEEFEYEFRSTLTIVGDAEVFPGVMVVGRERRVT